jgi:ABC-type glycerol-3-phosphate transport system substrate-binding protein
VAGRKTRRAVVRGASLAALGASSLGALAVACAPGMDGSANSRIGGRNAKIAFAYATTVAEQDALRAGPVKLFRQKYPNVAVEEITAPGGELKEKTQAMVAAGTAPDVMHLAGGGTGGPDDLASRGVLLKLDDHIKRDHAFKWDDF